MCFASQSVETSISERTFSPAALSDRALTVGNWIAGAWGVRTQIVASAIRQPILTDLFIVHPYLVFSVGRIWLTPTVTGLGLPSRKGAIRFASRFSSASRRAEKSI